MNPYDFVRIDWSCQPRRRCPIWHHQLVGNDSQRLYSGQIDIDIYAETPLFVPERSNFSKTADPKKPKQFFKNSHDEYIIPGSSLKGMLRTVVESLGNGCLTLFDGRYEQHSRNEVDYWRNTPQLFRKCESVTNLCIACRIFGMLQDRDRGNNNTSQMFLGKINIGDAVAYPGQAYKYEPIYTIPLMAPKPHHDDFYLDEAKKHIAGRKFYFHHPSDIKPLTARGFIHFGKNQTLANQYILPLDNESAFHFRLDFTNLEEDEFAVLLLALVLEEDMRHKIGYGKPMGLGTIQLAPASITLVDYQTRYTNPGQGRGKTSLIGDVMWNEIYRLVDSFSNTQLMQLAMDDLRRIWMWPPDSNVDYYYPSKTNWFDTPDSRGKRIADTIDVPEQTY
jgi:CRISPR/Cas system CSM-associated protein Csm3 (group 7 of RAMP superfamily)